jgi:hypothetical protein
MNWNFWGGIGLGLIALAVMPLSAATNSGPIQEPWPALLSSVPLGMDPEVALLHARANAVLDAVLRATPVPEASLHVWQPAVTTAEP